MNEFFRADFVEWVETAGLILALWTAVGFVTIGLLCTLSNNLGQRR